MVNANRAHVAWRVSPTTAAVLPLWLAVLLSTCTVPAHAVVFPDIALPVDQARTCLQRAFSSGEPKDKKVFSQLGEDGVIETIFECIGTTSKYFVEFGVENGQECTTRNLRENHGFTGLMMDGGNSRPEINLQQEMMFSHNIVQLFEKYKVPKPSFDHLTVDLDQNTFWIAQAVLHAGYKPRSLTIEFNHNLAWTDSYATIDMPNEMAFVPDVGNSKVADCYYSASAKAWVILAKSYGYHLVAANQLGVNLFFVHETIIGKEPLFNLEDAKRLFSKGQEYSAIHGQCVRHVWLKVDESTDFAAADFRAGQLQKVVLSHKPGTNGQRMFYEVEVDKDLFGAPRGASVSASQDFSHLLSYKNAASSTGSGVELWAVACMLLVAFAAGAVAHHFLFLHRVFGVFTTKSSGRIRG